MSYNRPVDVLIGRWEAGLVRDGTHSHATLKWMCDAVEGFFADHQRVKYPEQIQITDSEDWRIGKLDDGVAWNVVRADLCAVKAFFNYLRREHEEYSGLDNPIYVPPPKRKTLDTVV